MTETPPPSGSTQLHWSRYPTVHAGVGGHSRGHHRGHCVHSAGPTGQEVRLPDLP